MPQVERIEIIGAGVVGIHMTRVLMTLKDATVTVGGTVTIPAGVTNFAVSVPTMTDPPKQGKRVAQWKQETYGRKTK